MRQIEGAEESSERVAGVVRAMLGRQRWWIALALALTFLSLLVVASTIVTIKSVFDDAIVARTVPLSELVDALVFLAVCGFVVGLPLRLVGSRIVYQLEYDMRTWLYARLQALDPRRLDGLPAGQLVTRSLTDLAYLEELTAILPVLVVGFVIVTAAAVVMVVINPLMGLVTLAAIPVNIAVVARMAGRLRALSWLALHSRAAVTTRIDEAVRGIRVVKAFAAEPAERSRVGDAAASAYAVAIARVRLLARYGLPVKAIPVLLDGLLVYLGARLAVAGDFTVGALVVYLGFAVFFTGLAAQLDDAVGAYQFARTGSSRILELISGSSASSGGGAELAAEPTTGLRVLAGNAADGTLVEVVARPGSWVVLAANQPDGASWLARVCAGAEISGAALAELDGVPIDALADDVRRRSIRLVSRDPFLFGRSVRENLLLGASDGTTESDLHAALVAAGAEEFVAALPGGLDAEVGDRGLTLSGGQRQRLALARALVAPPRVLVLDEALSAVDAGLEVDVLRSVRHHAPSMAVVVASSRPGPRSVADEVVEVPDLPPGAARASEGEDRFEQAHDAALAASVAELHVAERRPPVTDAQATDDHAIPRLRTIVALSPASLAIATTSLIALSLVTIVPSALFQFAVDGIEGGDVGPATAVALALVPVALCLSALTYIVRLSVTTVNETALYVLRRRVFQRLSRLGVDYYDRELPGRVAARVVYDLDRITEFINNGVFPLATSAFLFLSASGVLLVVSPSIFLGVAPFVVLILVSTALEVPVAQRAFVAARTSLGVVVQRFHEDFSGRHVIDAFGGRAPAFDAFAATCRDLRRCRRRATTVSNLYLSVVELLAALATAALIARAAGAAIEGDATIGSVVFLQLLLTQALAPIPALSGILQTYLNARASFRELAEPFAVDVRPVDADDPLPCPALSGAVALEQVSFGYPGTGREVLHDVTLRIAPGEVVALVGPTGAGKSSIAKLLARLYDPDRGRVTADGVPARDYELHAYRRRLGIVPQDAFCFAGTVGSNIAYGRPDATAQQQAAALEACGGAEVLAGLPDGLRTAVDEEGRNLPPAVRQWLALARMWLVEPDVLVLDEATAALPAVDEQRVVERLRSTGRTAVMVTHRLPVACRADRVVVVADGHIVEEGSHEELCSREGRYRAAWERHEGLEADHDRTLI